MHEPRDIIPISEGRPPKLDWKDLALGGVVVAAYLYNIIGMSKTNPRPSEAPHKNIQSEAAPEKTKEGLGKVREDQNGRLR